MNSVSVKLGPRSYDILIGPDLLEQFGQFLNRYKLGKRVFLISNQHVFSLYGNTVQESLVSEGAHVTEILIPDGESFKNLETVEKIYTCLMAQRADRNSTIIALGGGVTGDIAGFAAATFLRGISYVQVPTTLLSQVDSSVGGKTGVNHQKGKNLIGAFYQPKLVLADTDTLSTLSNREFQSGIYEIVKYGLIYDETFFEFLESNFENLLIRDFQTLERIVARCCQIKSAVISQDEHESDLRRILNFGHTFGHALEAIMGYSGITHGEAIGWGMLIATEISLQKKFLDAASARRVVALISRLGALPKVDWVEFDDLLELLEHDKKRQDSQLHFVLLNEIGKTLIRTDVPPALLREAWQSVTSSRVPLPHG